MTPKRKKYRKVDSFFVNKTRFWEEKNFFFRNLFPKYFTISLVHFLVKITTCFILYVWEKKNISWSLMKNSKTTVLNYSLYNQNVFFRWSNLNVYYLIFEISKQKQLLMPFRKKNALNFSIHIAYKWKGAFRFPSVKVNQRLTAKS